MTKAQSNNIIHKQLFKVYIINLDKDKDRMAFMDKQMNALGIIYERLPAIYGKEYNFDKVYDEKLCIRKNGRPLTPGELGCALSHRMCYELVLNTVPVPTSLLGHNNNYTLILEDDVCLPKDFRNIINRQIEIREHSNNNSWDYLLFDYPKPGIYFIRHWIGSIFLNYKSIKASKSVIKNIVTRLRFIAYSIIKALYILPLAILEGLRDYYYVKAMSKSSNGIVGDAVRFYRPLYLAGAYLITDKVASPLYSLSDPIIYPADRTPDEARKQLGMQFYAYAPLCVYQKRQSFGSSILDIDSIEEVPVDNL